MAAVVFDMVRRYLIYRGYEVHYVTNFTDVDDKIIRRANETGQDPVALANHYAEEYLRQLDATQRHARRHLSARQHRDGRDHPLYPGIGRSGLCL